MLGAVCKPGWLELGLVNRLCEVGQGTLGPSRPFGLIVCQTNGRGLDLKITIRILGFKVKIHN